MYSSLFPRNPAIARLFRTQYSRLPTNRWTLLLPRHNHSVGFKRAVLSHAFAGVAGGLTVITVVAGYAWYHLSAYKSASIARKIARIQGSLDQRDSKRAFYFLGSLAKSYVTVIPGGALVVDWIFDSLSKVVDAHSDEAYAITCAAYQDIREIIEQHGEEGRTAVALKMIPVLRRTLGELRALEGGAGVAALGPLAENFPEVKLQVAAGLGKLQTLVNSRSSNRDEIHIDAQQQVNTATANDKTLTKARDFIRGNTSKPRRERPSGDVINVSDEEVGNH